jgi:hypothetical protein
VCVDRRSEYQAFAKKSQKQSVSLAIEGFLSFEVTGHRMASKNNAAMGIIPYFSSTTRVNPSLLISNFQVQGLLQNVTADLREAGLTSLCIHD